jgi:hypothetical protein
VSYGGTTVASSSADPDAAVRVARLRSELRNAQRRYGIGEGPPQIAGLELAIDRRQNRAAHLETQIEELRAEVDRLRQEIAGFAKGLEALLSEEIERIRESYAEAWSPTAVLGFRLWSLEDDRLEGARIHWSQPHLEARCASTDSNPDEVPHSDGRCGRLGCGIYAAKEITPLLRELTLPTSRNFVAGLVALSGKVVEHDRGYRGAVADVVAVAVVGHAQILFSDDPELIARLFHHPAAVLTDHGPGTEARTGRMHAAIAEYLTTQLRRRLNPWTSESNTA